jgi:hypothetical protein
MRQENGISDLTPANVAGRNVIAGKRIDDTGPLSGVGIRQSGKEFAKRQSLRVQCREGRRQA